MFSDGCACQFKNRWTLSLVLTAKDLFGIDLTWNFFESGHGKGVVDGIGGIVKRYVYQRIMTGAARVYSAKEFHKCLSENIEGITSTYISEEQFKIIETALADKWKKVKAIPNVTKFYTFKKKNEKTLAIIIVQ